MLMFVVLSANIVVNVYPVLGGGLNVRIIGSFA